MFLGKKLIDCPQLCHFHPFTLSASLPPPSGKLTSKWSCNSHPSESHNNIHSTKYSESWREKEALILRKGKCQNIRYSDRPCIKFLHERPYLTHNAAVRSKGWDTTDMKQFLEERSS